MAPWSYFQVPYSNSFSKINKIPIFSPPKAFCPPMSQLSWAYTHLYFYSHSTSHYFSKILPAYPYFCMETRAQTYLTEPRTLLNGRQNLLTYSCHCAQTGGLVLKLKAAQVKEVSLFVLICHPQWSRCSKLILLKLVIVGHETILNLQLCQGLAPSAVLLKLHYSSSR